MDLTSDVLERAKGHCVLVDSFLFSSLSLEKSSCLLACVGYHGIHSVNISCSWHLTMFAEHSEGDIPPPPI